MAHPAQSSPGSTHFTFVGPFCTHDIYCMSVVGEVSNIVYFNFSEVFPHSNKLCKDKGCHSLYRL